MILVAAFGFGLAFLFAPSSGIIPRFFRRRAQSARIRRENSLKAIYHQLEAENFTAERVDIADLVNRRQRDEEDVRLEIRHLANHGFVDLSGESLRLTDTGWRKAREVVRNHRLWELYLTHAADIALGIPETRDRDDELTKARAALNWEKHFNLSFDPDTARAYHDEDLDVDTDFCAMCGHDWCSVRISKEIQEFASGKEDEYDRGAPVKSAALTEEQQRILEQRGYLKPEEIHKLASKTKKAVGADEGKADCHSDYVDPDEAQEVAPKEALVQLNTAEAHGLSKNDSII